MSSGHVRFSESAEHGVILSIDDPAEADRFDDYLSEQCFVPFNVRFEDAGDVSFLFGQASSTEKVRALYSRFLAGAIGDEAARRGEQGREAILTSVQSGDLRRHYSGYLRLEHPSESLTAQLQALVGHVPGFDVAPTWIEIEYEGRDSSRLVVRLLASIARLVRDATGEVRCEVSGDTDQWWFEFYRIRAGQLFVQRGDVVRRVEHAVVEEQP